MVPRHIPRPACTPQRDLRRSKHAGRRGQEIAAWRSDEWRRLASTSCRSAGAPSPHHIGIVRRAGLRTRRLTHRVGWRSATFRRTIVLQQGSARTIWWLRGAGTRAIQRSFRRSRRPPLAMTLPSGEARACRIHGPPDLRNVLPAGRRRYEMRRRMRLKDRIAIGHGRGSGAGRAACVAAFAREGASVLVADIEASSGAADQPR